MWQQYPLGLLREWQANAVKARQSELTGAQGFHQTVEGNKSSLAGVKQFLREARQVRVDEYPALYVSAEALAAMAQLAQLWKIDRTAANPMHGGYPGVTRLQHAVVDLLTEITNQVRQGGWTLQDGFYYPPMPPAVSIGRVRAAWRDVSEMISKLTRYANGVAMPGDLLNP